MQSGATLHRNSAQVFISTFPHFVCGDSLLWFRNGLLWHINLEMSYITQVNFTENVRKATKMQSKNKKKKYEKYRQEKNMVARLAQLYVYIPRIICTQPK